MKNKKCSNCKNLQQTVYMKLEDETLYNIWCKVGNIEDKNCDKFEEEFNCKDKLKDILNAES